MKKTTLNFVIDILMFICMSALAGIGFLLEYVLVNGQEKWEKFGENIDQTLWGLDRHQWGNIHLILGIALLVLLVLHIVYHWKLIKSIYKRLIPGNRIRKTIAIVFLFICLLFFFFPFIITPHNSEVQKGHGHFEKQENVIADSSEIQTINDQKIHQHEFVSSEEHLDIKGYMTLHDVSDRYQISTVELKKKLNIPQDISASQRLGQLKRIYHFTMSDISKIVNNTEKKD